MVARSQRSLVFGALLAIAAVVVGAGLGSAAVATTTTVAPTTSTTFSSHPTVTLTAVGDTELGNTPRLPPDPATYFAPVEGVLAAPIVFGNLEGTMTTATTSKCARIPLECYAFRVPPSYAEIYRRAGFTVLNSANNHSDDYGPLGVAQTSAALRSAGIVQAGLPGQIGLVREGPLRVAFVDFAPYSVTNDMLDPAAATALIARARREANVVVVYMHAGAEGTTADHVTRSTEYFFGENRGNPYAFAHQAIDAGADLVIASGPHVLRGMQWYRGHLIDYSLGNFANYEDFATFSTLALSGILRVTLNAAGAFVAGHFTSLRLAATGQAFVDPTHDAANFVNQLSREDFGASAAVILPSGAIRPQR